MLTVLLGLSIKKQNVSKKLCNKNNNNKLITIVKPDKDDPQFTPSPANYVIKDTSGKSPAWRIGTAKRKLTEIKSTTPGSGKYSYKSFIGEGPKYSMRPKFDLDGTNSAKRLDKGKTKYSVPGPGKYDPLDNTSGPHYTIGMRRSLTTAQLKRKSKTKETPGVGKYNLRNDADLIVPCYIMSKEKRNNLNMNHSAIKYPAPNKYHYDLNGSSSQGPIYSFPKAERFGSSNKGKKPQSAALKRSSSVPGPGAYEHQKFIGWEGPNYSFPKDKFNHADAVDESMSNKTMNYPSPTTYQKNIRYIPDSPIITISNSKKKETISDKGKINTPGPGYYKPNKYNASVMKHFPAWSIYKSERDESKNENAKKKAKIITPGPGHYNLKQGRMPEGPMYTLAQKFKEKKIDDYPGPGKYSIVNVIYPCEPQFSMGKEKKLEENNKQNNKAVFPGPGAYNVKDNLFTKGVQFTKDKKFKEKRFITPGPGQYKIPTSFDYINDYTRSKGFFDPTFKYV